MSEWGSFLCACGFWTPSRLKAIEHTAKCKFWKEEKEPQK